MNYRLGQQMNRPRFLSLVWIAASTGKTKLIKFLNLSIANIRNHHLVKVAEQ
jgi:hypothetical protein